jgi:2-amino-4-hydroxy-6-hydroxymethyldihydropteridine diphosphokinase
LTTAARAFVGLGANLAGTHGGPQATLAAAVEALAGLPQTSRQAVSRVYVSDPVEAAGPPFYNQVAELHSRLAPAALLDALQAIEADAGRERPYRNAPRTLDLDLLMVGDLRMQTPRLTLPHPRMHERLFVLMPLCELDAALWIPGRGTVSDCLAAVQATQSQRCAPADGSTP